MCKIKTVCVFSFRRINVADGIQTQVSTTRT
uniref:Uncharacterized protein n=1 Tax=Rhizophora mucronata TaxID=61149 RepID=A0A2P2PY94_RHIMU